MVDQVEEALMSDPRVALAAEQLYKRVIARCQGQRLTTGIVGNVAELIKDHRRECRIKGIPFPPMTIFVVPEHGAIEVVRADMEMPGVNQLVLNMVQKIPEVTMPQLAEAVARAFPHLRPKDFNPALAMPSATLRRQEMH